MIGLYARVSTTEQALNGHSVSEQQERMKAYCEAMGWKSYKAYVDPGFSGASMNRPALQDLISDVEKGKVNKILVWKLDRLSRSQKDTLFLIEDVFLKHSCDFVSMNENFDTSTPFGRAMIGILSVFAQLEREQIKERMMMGKEARSKEGKWHGGRYTPLGYGYEGGELVPLPYYSDQVKELFNLYSSGIYATEIVRIFHDKGYLTQQGREWTVDQIRRTIQHKVYIGYITDGRQWYKGTHEPIIDEPTFNEVNKIYAKRRDNRIERGIVSTPNQTTALGGFIRCAHCGALYGKNVSNHGKYKYAYYSCYSRLKRNPVMIKDPACKNKHWKMDELDQLVFGEIKKLTLEDRKEERKPIDISPLERRIKDIDSQISRLLDLYGLGKVPLEQLDSKINSLQEEKEKLSRQITAQIDSNRPSFSELDKCIKSFNEILGKGNLQAVRGIITALIDRIEIDNENVTIHWRF